MNDFDAEALFAAMDSQRTIRGLSWRQVAAEIRDQSRELNARRNDHPISPSTLTGIARRRDTSCQHALSILRWLDCAPERFLRLPPAADRVAALPAVGPDRRLRWNLKAMHAALDARRRELDVTWKALASGIGCTASQLTGLKTARYATSMRLATPARRGAFAPLCLALLLLGAAPGRARAQGLVTIARRTLAAALDSTLPRVEFDRWLAGLGGNQPLPVRWEVNDCGEGGDGREAPTCVEATLDLAGDSTAHVSLVVADVAGKRVTPAVWDLSIGAGGSFTGFGSLHAWSAYVRMHHRQH